MQMVHELKKNNRKIPRNTMIPRGIHHTVSYATSFDDTWGHIKKELKKAYPQVHSQQETSIS